DVVLAKAMAKNRDDRFATARDFAVALKQASQKVQPGSSAPGAGAGSPAPTAPGTSAPTGGTAPSSGTRPSGDSAPDTTINLELELEYWKDIRDSEDPADFEDFLRQFPNGKFAARAQSRLRRAGG